MRLGSGVVGTVRGGTNGARGRSNGKRFVGERRCSPYLSFATSEDFDASVAWAAASRATGTLKGEHDT